MRYAFVERHHGSWPIMVQCRIAEPAARLNSRPVRASICSLPKSVLVVAAGADLQNPALDHNRPRAMVSLDKGIPHSDSLAKYAVAFFGVALHPHTQQLGFQPGNLHLSAVNALPRTSRSRPDASACTQLSSDRAETPIVRVTADSFSTPRINRNASCLNSSVYRARTPSFFPDTPSMV